MQQAVEQVVLMQIQPVHNAWRPYYFDKKSKSGESCLILQLACSCSSSPWPVGMYGLLFVTRC